MNKKRILLFAGILTVLISSWIGYNKYREVIPPIDTAKSEIGWSAKSVSDTHVGKIQLQKAAFKFQNNQLTGGNFEVNMDSITVIDIVESQDKADFIDHLTNGDFFETNLYPRAYFVITQVQPKGELDYVITGNLTIKKVTKPITFTAKVTNSTTNKSISANIEVDRTLFGIEYGAKGKRGSEKDWFIHNEIMLRVNIVIGKGNS